ncbi:jg1044 [Pararge aegeria aegeria]|uniref:Jg1044 protein n=1 Tax=Pararge aegeria aegeria TaxID=348720 RepID=A0A8S4QYM3_9NEOP|nr:jg1044 [Pararge aegeria aegeria]
MSCTLIGSDWIFCQLLAAVRNLVPMPQREEPRATDLRYRSPDEKRPRVGRRTECSWYASDGVWRPRKGPPVEGLPRQTPLAGMCKIAQVFPCPSHQATSRNIAGF